MITGLDLGLYIILKGKMSKRMMWKYKKHINDGAWKEVDLVGCLSEDMIDHIITDIKPETGGLNDKSLVDLQC